jgi:hypothetical protein
VSIHAQASAEKRLRSNALVVIKGANSRIVGKPDRVVEVLRVRYYSELFGQKHFDDSRSTV